MFAKAAQLSARCTSGPAHRRLVTALLSVPQTSPPTMWDTAKFDLRDTVFVATKCLSSTAQASILELVKSMAQAPVRGAAHGSLNDVTVHSRGRIWRLTLDRLCSSPRA